MVRHCSKTQRVCHYVGGAQEFKPIGDACSCGNCIVKPATPPKPLCGCQVCFPIPSIKNVITKLKTEICDCLRCKCDQFERAEHGFVNDKNWNVDDFEFPSSNFHYT